MPHAMLVNFCKFDVCIRILGGAAACALLLPDLRRIDNSPGAPGKDPLVLADKNLDELGTVIVDALPRADS